MAIQKRNYWTDETRLSEIKKVMEQLGHFPEQSELEYIGRYDLKQTITRHGGLTHYRSIMGIPKKQKHTKANFDKVLSDIKSLVTSLEHFPTIRELIQLRMGSIVYDISKTGGITVYRNALGFKPLIVEDNHYTLEQIVSYITNIKGEIGRFPTYTELKSNKEWNRITYGIKLNGGMNNIRSVMGYPILKERNKTHSEESVCNAIKNYIDTKGLFPTRKLLESEGNTKLISAIHEMGGFNYYRTKLGHPILKEHNGYWDYDTTYSKLKGKIDVLGYYPSMGELDSGLVHAILRHGGNTHFRRMFGYKEDYWSDMCSYLNKRGRNTEKLLLQILQDYCNRKGIVSPTLNKRFPSNKVIEFVCDIGKTIGIDVCNTRDKNTIQKKWIKKDYHKYLDELIIVVFSNVFTKNDYDELNRNSPDNVSILSIEEFCKKLEYDLDDSHQKIIEKYNSCAFDKRKKETKEVS